MGRGSGGCMRRQDGAQVLELVAMLPLLLITVLLLWQFALAGYTLIVAEAVVRDAVRAAADGDDPTAAARLSAGNLSVTVDPPQYAQEALGCQVTVRLQVRVPAVGLSLLRGQTLTLARQAAMPAAPDLCP